MNQENNPYRPEENPQGSFPYGQNNTPAPEPNPSAPTSPASDPSGLSQSPDFGFPASYIKPHNGYLFSIW